MSTPKNHHFIPKVYLKEFANYQQHLYQLYKSHKNISIKSTSQICYKPNYFKLSSLEEHFPKNVNDLYHIEKTTFAKHENAYSKLVKKITHPSLSYITISKYEVEYFLEILLTFKRRGPIYRQEIISTLQRKVMKFNSCSIELTNGCGNNGIRKLNWYCSPIP